jgi:uncharacterized protein YdhG (YjbR/CyaY superfamily)
MCLQHPLIVPYRGEMNTTTNSGVTTMAETKTAPGRARKSTRRNDGFTAEERAAMKERVREQKKGKADGERDVLDKIAEMQGSDRAIAERLHAIIAEAAPGLTPRTYYGMPAYAKDEKVLCFFKPAGKFKSRYATLGFTDKANLDDGAMWATEFALVKLTGTEEKRIRGLLKQAL